MIRMTGLTGGAFALSLVLASCEPVDDSGDMDDMPEAAEELGDDAIEREEALTASEIRVEDIVGEPARFAGRTVTVTADLEEVVGPRAFKLDEDAPLQGGIDNDLLVIGRSAGLAEIDDQWLDNRVRVTGTVQVWTVVEIEREVGWDLNPEIEAELEDREAVLIADRVERVPEER